MEKTVMPVIVLVILGSALFVYNKTNTSQVAVRPNTGQAATVLFANTANNTKNVNSIPVAERSNTSVIGGISARKVRTNTNTYTTITVTETK